MNCCNPMTGQCEEGPGCPVRCEKVMKMPLIQKNSDDTDPEIESNSPWDWIGDLRVWVGFAIILAATAAVTGLVAGSIYARFFN